MPAKPNVVVFTYHLTALPFLRFLKKTTNISAIILPANREPSTLLPIITWAEKNHISYLKTDNCNDESIVKKIITNPCFRNSSIDASDASVRAAASSIDGCPRGATISINSNNTSVLA